MTFTNRDKNLDSKVRESAGYDPQSITGASLYSRLQRGRKQRNWALPVAGVGVLLAGAAMFLTSPSGGSGTPAEAAVPATAQAAVRPAPVQQAALDQDQAAAAESVSVSASADPSKAEPAKPVKIARADKAGKPAPRDEATPSATEDGAETVTAAPAEAQPETAIPQPAAPQPAAPEAAAPSSDLQVNPVSPSAPPASDETVTAAPSSDPATAPAASPDSATSPPTPEVQAPTPAPTPVPAPAPVQPLN